MSTHYLKGKASVTVCGIPVHLIQYPEFWTGSFGRVDCNVCRNLATAIR